MNFKKIFTLLCMFWLISLMPKVSAQVSTTVGNPTTQKLYLEMMQDPNVNFYEAQSAFNKYWANRSDHKGNGYKVFKRWEYINESRVLPDGELQAPEQVMTEFNKYMSKLDGPTSASGNWTIQGPTQYVINNTGQPTGMGRVNAIAFHPADVNTIFIGAPSGGIWKTINGGITWVNLSNNLPKLGVSSILIHPTDPNIIYIGTGDRDASDAPGLGVFKSSDGGSTWTQINNTMGNVIVGDMLMHPSDPNTILAATNIGIYKTTNGGATWLLVSTIGQNFKDIQFKPGDPSIVYGVRIMGTSRLYRSSNTGNSWTQVTSGIPTTGIGSRMVIGTSPANPNYVYLLQIKSSDGTFANLLRSTDAGLSFTSMSSSPNILGYNCDGSGTASQATYDLCINVDPNNANTVFVGGINTWKSIDGGATWNSSTNWGGTCSGTVSAVHADHHVLEWNPLNGALYLGHDGGITYTANGGASWTEITGGLPITQLYKIGQGASNTNYTVFGCQDNGIGATINGSTFYTVNGGDGGECIIDYANSNYCYDTYVEGVIRRSTTGPLGSYSDIAYNGLNGIDEIATWIIPYFLHKTDHLTMFAGYTNLWRSNNATSSPPTWTKISNGETSVCKVLEQSVADLGVVYVVRSGSLKRTDNANDAAASVTWTACTLPDGLTPTYLATHPTNSNIVYATAGNSVYKSTDKGLTWTDMDPNISLPDLFNNCLVYDKNSNEGIYMGNQTGVWYKNATMTDWVLFSGGLPPVDVRELEIFYDPTGTQHRLKAATYGRGLWQSDLKETGVLNPANITATVINIDKIDVSWALTAGNNVMLAYSSSPIFGTPENGTSYAASLGIPGGGTVLYNGNAALFNHTGLSASTTYYYKLWSYDGGIIYSTGTTANAATTFSIANFTEDVTLSCAGSLAVNFTDVSIAAYNSWAWDIDNNGTTDYTTQNPTHTYSSPGLYSVKLTINNGIADALKENLILIMASEPTLNTGCALSSNSNNGNGYGIGIYRFALGNIDFTTSNNDGYYKNYSCSKWARLELNKSYNISIRTGTANNEGAKVFIDYNDNGTFEPGEAVISFPANKDGTRTLSFTTPSSGVVFDKGLRLRVLSKFGSIPSTACDISTYGQAEDYTVYFESPVWNGNTDADWYTATNWNINVVPGSGVNVKIPTGRPNYPVLTSNVTCGNLTIETGASVTVNYGIGLTVNGTLLNSAGNTGLVVKSGGSLIESTTGISATVERDIPANEWHLISAPESGIVSGMFTGQYLQTHNESSNAYTDVLSTTDALSVMKGYALWTAVSPYVAQFTGTLNTGSQNYNTSYSGSGNGWNLVGNPYPSSIDWNASGWTKSNVNGSIYIHKNSSTWATFNGTTGTNGGTRYIAPCQGFFVEANAAGSLAMTNSVKVHNATPFYKNSDDVVSNLIRLEVSGNSYTDEAVVWFMPEATPEFDSQFDAHKLFGDIAEAAQIYTLGSTALSINTLPETNTVPVGLHAGASGNYTISAPEINNFSEVSLEDTKTGVLTDLMKNSYSFNYIPGGIENRFLLHFGPLSVAEANSPQVNIYGYSRTVYVDLKNKAKGDIFIYNISGQLVAAKKEAYGMNTFSLDNTGNYIVKIISPETILVKKLWIQ
jgi:PKD repeat protein